VSWRALLWITAAAILTASCGEIVQIGAQGEPPTPLPLPIDACSNLACGEPCPLTKCTGTECPPSAGGFCNSDGICTLNTPACVVPDARCSGVPCGAPCAPCVPANPSCSTSTDAGPDSPPMVCDAFQKCKAGTITCL
jgi:hypothetical protein